MSSPRYETRKLFDRRLACNLQRSPVDSRCSWRLVFDMSGDAVIHAPLSAIAEVSVFAGAVQ